MQKIFVIILSILSIAQCCRVIQDRSSGGISVEREDYSSVVLIETFINYDLKYFCTGVLISPNYVLTTARCVISSIFVNVHIYAYKLFDVFEDKREIYRSTEITFKPNFERYVNHNDIALIKLPVTLNLAVKDYTIAQLPTAPLAENSQGKAVGWGLIDFYDEDEYATELKTEIDLTFVPEADCRLAYPRLNWTEFGEGGRGCVLKTSGKNCVSGHGSPLIVNNIVYGLHSFAYGACEDDGVLSGIQLIYYHLQWIRENSDY